MPEFKTLSIIMAVLWTGGFVFALMPLEAYESHFFGAAFLCMAAAAFTGLLTGRAVRDYFDCAPVLTGALAAFWALAFLSVVLSESPYTSFIYFCLFSCLPLSFLTVLTVPDRAIFVRVVSTALLSIFAALSIFSLVQFFAIPAMLSNGLAQWPLDNPNSYGGLLSLGLFLTLGRIYTAENTAAKRTFVALGVLVFAALLATGSRGALLALILAGGIFVLTVAGTMKRGFVALAGGIMLCAVLALLLSLSQVSGQTPLDVWQFTMLQGKGFLSSRPDIWVASWQSIQQHFWSGTGMGTFFLYYPEVRGGDIETAGLMAHSDPVQFLTEMGVVAPILFYFILLAAVWKTLRVLRGNEEGGAHLAAMACGLSAMALHTHITFHFYVLSILILSGYMLAQWFAQIHESRDMHVHSSVQSGFLQKSLSPAVLMVLVFAFISQHQSEILVDRARRQIAAGNLEGFARDINMADKISFGRNARALILAATVPLGILQDRAALLPPGEGEALFTQARQTLDKAIALNPRLVAAYHHQARLEAYAPQYAGRPSQAEEILSHALRIDPLHAASREYLAQILSAAGHRDEALDILKAGLKWPYRQQDAASYYQITMFLALELGDTETHVQAAALFAESSRRAMRKSAENKEARITGIK